jgi:hypothetical protein
MTDKEYKASERRANFFKAVAERAVADAKLAAQRERIASETFERGRGQQLTLGPQGEPIQ